MQCHERKLLNADAPCRGHRGGDAKLSGLRTMAPRPMPETTITVGAALLANEAFLRSNVDQAIASLTEDGTIQSILDEFRFPAKAVKP